MKDYSSFQRKFGDKRRAKGKTRPKFKRPPINNCLICDHPLEHTRYHVEIIPFCRNCQEEAKEKGLSAWELLAEKQAKASERKIAMRIEGMITNLGKTCFPLPWELRLLETKSKYPKRQPAPLACLYKPKEIKRLVPGRSRLKLLWEKLK